jgi:hypothetical protein
MIIAFEIFAEKFRLFLQIHLGGFNCECQLFVFSYPKTKDRQLVYPPSRFCMGFKVILGRLKCDIPMER